MLAVRDMAGPSGGRLVAVIEVAPATGPSFRILIRVLPPAAGRPRVVVVSALSGAGGGWLAGHPAAVAAAVQDTMAGFGRDAGREVCFLHVGPFSGDGVREFFRALDPASADTPFPAELGGLPAVEEELAWLGSPR